MTSFQHRPVVCIITILALAFQWTKNDYGYGLFSTSTISTIGFGAANLRAILDGQFTILSTVIIANLPQLPLILIYYLYTDLFTRMLMTHSWTSFTRKPKGLRVASPRGSQRSTYLFGILYRYGVPFLALSVLLHWTTSQSIFLVAVAVVSDTNTRLLPGTPKDMYGAGAGISGVGFSPLAAIITVVLLFVLMGATLGLGYRRFNSDAPIIRCSSLEIRGAATFETPWTASMVEGRIRYSICGENADGSPRYSFCQEFEDRRGHSSVDAHEQGIQPSPTAAL